MRYGYWFVILLFVIAIPGSAQVSDPVHVPFGTVPVLDGTLAADEWEDAFSIPLNEESTLFLKHAEGYLFLAVRAMTMGVPSPLVVQGDEVHALHASAALGTAIYAQEVGVWGLQQSFEWQCRTRGFSAYAVEERARFLEQNGWLGTIGYVGTPTEFEYKILLDEEPLRMLFLFLETTDPLQLLSWPVPADVADAYLEIITGPIPNEVSFDFDRWAVLVPVQE